LISVIIAVNSAEGGARSGPTAAEEPRIFQQFLDLVSLHKDAWLYAYGSYEATFLRRLAKRLGQEKLVSTILTRTFNVLSVLHSHVYFPTYSNGLKDIAGYLGCRWTAADASGIQSIVWRRRWEETGSGVMKETLTTYNLEDCLALQKVTEFPQVCLVSQQRTPTFQARRNRRPCRGDGPVVQCPDWDQGLTAVPDFAFINDVPTSTTRGQVYVRTNKPAKNRNASVIGRERRTSGPTAARPQRVCPSCNGRI
jgi:hypothetical protein